MWDSGLNPRRAAVLRVAVLRQPAGIRMVPFEVPPGIGPRPATCEVVIPGRAGVALQEFIQSRAATSVHEAVQAVADFNGSGSGSVVWPR